MWKLSVTNNYEHPLKIEGKEVAKGETFEPDKEYGSVIVEVPGLGPLNFLDMCEEHIDGPSVKKLGVYITYQSDECYYKYEEAGKINIVINFFGQAEIVADGDLSVIHLDSFIFPKKE